MTNKECTGTWVDGDELDEIPYLVHDESTFCPVHDRKITPEKSPIVLFPTLPLTLDEYQERCGDTANYPEAGTGSIKAITYCVLGLAGEAGEVADKWKKVLRGDHGEGEVPQEIKDAILLEAGDVTWYSARLSLELGVALSKVAQGNLDKLASRKERGVIKGSGDLR